MRDYRRPTGAINALLAFALICFFPGAAWADAPRDMKTNQRLWLDGLDVNGTDTGNGGGTNPGNGAQVTAWKDKSPNGYTAGDAVSYGAFAHSFPTYTAGSGVFCDGISNALEITNGIHPNGNVTATDIFVVVSTNSVRTSSLFMAGLITNDVQRINVHLPLSNGIIYWDHNTSNGRITASWAGQLNQSYIYNLGATSGASQILTRDGTTMASASTSGTYTKGTGHHFFLCNGDATVANYHHGLVREMIVYNRRLNTAEKNILQSYLAAKHANPGGAGAANRYTVTGAYRYYVGGIGQESDGSLTTGTSAGLTIANGTLLANSRYLLAGTDSLNPAKGAVSTDLPAGYTARAARTWYATRTGTGTGTATMTFNLAQLGLVATTGAQLALFYRSGATGAYTASVVGTYNGSGTISFTVSNPQSGYYTLGGSVTTLAPAISLSLSDTVVSDGVNASNFKMIPGALLHTSAVVTNSGTASPDADTVELVLPVQPQAKLFVGDLAGVGTGPVQFIQGATPSGLTYTYGGLGIMGDRLDFSNDSGATWTYVPTPDAQQADAAVTNLRVRLGGTFANGVSPNFPSFTVKYGLVIK